MNSKKNGGVELKLHQAAVAMGFKKQRETYGRSRSATVEELEEKMFKPYSPRPNRSKPIVPPSGLSYAKYRHKHNQRARRLRADIFHFLEGCRTTYSAVYHVVVFLIICASLAMAILLSVKEFKDVAVYKFVMLIIEYLLLGIFTVEYFLRLWSSSAHGHYCNFFGKIRFIFTYHMILDLLVIFCSIALIYAKHMQLDPKTEKLLHLLLLLRILRVDRQNGSFAMLQRVFLKHRKELITCWYMSFIMIMFVAVLVYALETDPKEVTVNNLFNGFYWGVISLASIGYGDISPETAVSKILICVIAVFGTAFFAMPAGIIGSGFALQVAEHQKEKHINRKRRPAALLIQSFWRRYAGDHDLHATWLRHMIDRESRRITKQRIIKSQDVLQGHIPLSAVTGSSKPPPGDGGRSRPIQMQKLTLAEKNALRFIRRLKIRAALKIFRQARRPYDERDILDQFAAGQIEMFAKLRVMGSKVERISMTVERQTKIVGESNGRVTAVEHEILTLRENIVETKLLLHQILSHLPKPSEDGNLIDSEEQKYVSDMPREDCGGEVLGTEHSPVRIDFDDKVFADEADDEPDDELSTDDTDLAERQSIGPNEPPRRTSSNDNLRIMADLHSRRLLSIDSTRSMTDYDSFDSAM